jgi:hypothetical protein
MTKEVEVSMTKWMGNLFPWNKKVCWYHKNNKNLPSYLVFHDIFKLGALFQKTIFSGEFITRGCSSLCSDSSPMGQEASWLGGRRLCGLTVVWSCRVKYVLHLGLCRCMYLCFLSCVFQCCNCIPCPHNITDMKGKWGLCTFAEM